MKLRQDCSEDTSQLLTTDMSGFKCNVRSNLSLITVILAQGQLISGGKLQRGHFLQQFGKNGEIKTLKRFYNSKEV